MGTLLEFLLSKESYPERTKEIKLFETHISCVFVGDKFAYKIKKPVNFGFLDFTTLKKRLFYCKREVFLNSRLAKGYYLGVQKIYEKDGSYSFKRTKGSKVVEYAVKMKTIDEKKIVSKLIEDGEVIGKDIDKAVVKIANFHKNTTIYRDKPFGSPKSVARDNEENFIQIKPYIGKTITQELFNMIELSTKKFITKNSRLFNLRKKQGFVKEIHGDLHTKHICLKEPVVIFDCIEFNNRFRIGDVLEDIAFLLMDLEFRGRFDLSKRVLDLYSKMNKDYINYDLLLFYKVYRAIVRGKVESFMSDNLSNNIKPFKNANDYFNLAKYYVKNDDKPFNPIIFMGPSGSGKSSIAKTIKGIDVILRSDEIRKKLAGLEKHQHKYEDFQRGIYSKDMTEKTYKTLFDLALKKTQNGEKVLVDATFLTKNHRTQFLNLAESNDCNPIFVYLTAPEDVLFERIKQRKRLNNDISDADVNILKKQLEILEEPEELPSFRVLKLNTNCPLREISNSLQRLIL